METKPIRVHLKALCERTTDGEWKATGLTISAYGSGIISQSPVPQNGGTFRAVHNATFIAASHTAIPKLIGDVEMLRKALEQAEQQLDYGQVRTTALNIIKEWKS